MGEKINLTIKKRTGQRSRPIMKSYIKNLEFRIFSNRGDRFVTVDYDRNGEHSHYTLSDVPAWVRDEKSVRQYINRQS